MSAVLDFAVRLDWIRKNPMVGVSKGGYRNKENDRFITMAEYEKLLEACPSQEWRTIIALARIGGLRCPSELQQLRWSDVHLETNRFVVRSPKMERYEEKQEREVPLFPDLRVELMKHNQTTEFVIQSLQGTAWRLHEPFQKIARRSGVGMIVRPFDNMRMSRSNEVVREFGYPLESEWIGHSQKTMLKHYHQLADDDFAKAAG